MDLFVDTSALVKFYYEEEKSDKVESLILGANNIFISAITPIEMSSALAKKCRMKEISKTDTALVWSAFKDDLATGNFNIIDVRMQDVNKACDLLLKYGVKHNLRTLDSIQLTAALSCQRSVFLAMDEELISMAQKLGLKIAELD